MSSIINHFPPKEIIYRRSVENLPVTQRILAAFPEPGTRHIVYDGDSNKAKDIIQASVEYRNLHDAGAEDGLLTAKTIMLARDIWYLSDSLDVSKPWDVGDERIICHKLWTVAPISNGCSFHCQYCYLYGTYRAVMPFTVIRVDTDSWLPMFGQQVDVLSRESEADFNMGIALDAFFLAELTGIPGRLIRMFADKPRATLTMLSKDVNVAWLEEFRNVHNNRTVLSWSINAQEVAARYERRVPSLRQRLRAAAQCKEWGFRVRLRLDPIIPIMGWEDYYRDAVHEIFEHLTPEVLTIGALRFEKSTRPLVLGKVSRLPEFEDTGLPELVDAVGGYNWMFEPDADGHKGKLALHPELRIRIFRHVRECVETEYRARGIPRIGFGLCEETPQVTDAAGFERGICNCKGCLFRPAA